MDQPRGVEPARPTPVPGPVERGPGQVVARHQPTSPSRNFGPRAVASSSVATGAARGRAAEQPGDVSAPTSRSSCRSRDAKDAVGKQSFAVPSVSSAAALEMRRRVERQCLGDRGQRVLGGDQQGVEARVFQREGERRPGVVVAVVPVGRREPHVPPVVQVGRPVVALAWSVSRRVNEPAGAGSTRASASSQAGLLSIPDSQGCTTRPGRGRRGPGARADRRARQRASGTAPARKSRRTDSASSAWWASQTASACTGGCTIPEVSTPPGVLACQKSGPGK